MRTQLEAARSGTRAISMAALTLSMLGGVMLHQRAVGPARELHVFQRWMQVWADTLLRLFGVQFTLHGELPAPAPSGRLIISNHRSPIDVLILLRYFGGIALSRADLADWPVVGPAAKRAETIFVNRADTVSGVLAIRALRDRLSKARTVIVFPEGTTIAGDLVQPFQDGAFVAARGLPVEILPIGIAYEPGSEFLEDSFMEHVTRVARRKYTRVACVVGRPRPMPAHRKGLAESLREEVQGLVHEARRELDLRMNVRL
jgi:1-acyl-sn-glycerol-3-phosphate acyltransferase